MYDSLLRAPCSLLSTMTTEFEFGRIQSGYEWWIYGGILLAILTPLVWIYRRDARELPWYLRVGLPLLRTAVLIGLLFVYLQPRWRSKSEELLDSRVLLLVDTSLSMARLDPDTPGGRAGQTRLQQVTAALNDTDFLARLRKKHQVIVIPFNSVVEHDRQVTLSREQGAGSREGGELRAESRESRDGSPPADRSGRTTLNSQLSTLDSQSPPDWSKVLVPGGNDTRLGEALEQVVRKERNSPVSGIVLISDGGLNAGASPETALDLARESHIPIYTIGVGSEQKPRSVNVADFNVPPRVIPGDRFSVEGSLQGVGMKGRTVTVELLARDGAAAGDPLRRGQGERIDSREITLGEDDEAVPVKFDLPPLELGDQALRRRVLCLRVKSPAGVSGASDQFLEGEVVVSKHKTRVLLLAGGPMRDYQYVRTMLFRDKSTEVDVLLQSGQTGISQEATHILSEFPTSRSQMAEYDCLVGFDPDWQALKPDQIDILYQWVDEDHGGMIVVAGAVNTARAAEGWVQDAAMGKIRKLYPVEFNQGLSTKTNLMYGSDEAWRLEFTRDGLQAPYLWLGDTAVASQNTWGQFAGVYGFCPVRDKKEGATVLAYFSDPRTGVDGKQPIYMAVHRFSASPVVYLGSAETWRLRRLNPAWFEMLWTKLIRYASQEHLRRQSARGTLTIDHDRYQVGSTVEVQAELKNSALAPLLLKSVMLQITLDGKDQQPVPMLADTARPGRYMVDLPVMQQGEYRLEVLVPQSSNERLSRTFRGVVPKLEEENPQRNVALLTDIGKKTEGDYYPELAVAMSGKAEGGRLKAEVPPSAFSLQPSAPSLVDRLKDVSRPETVAVAPNVKDDEKLLKWMLWALCGVLSLEWLVRRLAKLA